MVMTKDDIAKFKELYVQTATVYLRDIGANMDAFISDQQNQTAVKNIHLASHSLAGQSIMMGYTNMSIFAGLIEKIFRAKLKDNRDLREEELLLIKDALIKMQKSLKQIGEGGIEINLSLEIKKLADMANLIK